MKKNLIIADLDGTLTNKSLVLSHCGHLISKGIIEDNGSFESWKLDKKNEDLIVATAENYRHQITGKKISELDCEQFVCDFMADDSNWYSTITELMIENELKTEIVLITGSSDYLVKILAKKLGFKYYATKYLVSESGYLTGDVKGMFSESQKDDCIQENLNLGEYNLIRGYGDTSSDNGIFKHCHENTLVTPTIKTSEYLLLKGTKIDRIITY